ncbi:MAG: hypothetical protein ACRDQA_10880 [Nocardioidaceae bacterium]
MRMRQARLRGHTRLHNPSEGDPLIVVLVDELASLTDYVTDREPKKRIGAALQLLLSQGRACGVVVVAALQDPRKDVLPLPGLFPTRIAAACRPGSTNQTAPLSLVGASEDETDGGAS